MFLSHLGFVCQESLASAALSRTKTPVDAAAAAAAASEGKENSATVAAVAAVDAAIVDEGPVCSRDNPDCLSCSS